MTTDDNQEIVRDLSLPRAAAMARASRVHANFQIGLRSGHRRTARYHAMIRNVGTSNVAPALT
jgi:hypothetical protein